MIDKYLSSLGYQITTDETIERIPIWRSWWEGKSKEFHFYTVYNGKRKIQQEMKSLQLGKTICEIWANMLFNEKCIISIEHEPTRKFVYEVFDNNNFWVKLNEMQEIKSALGTVCYIPYVEGMLITEEGNVLNGDGIAMSYITADNLKPISFKNGIVTELCVASKFSIDQNNYAYIQLFVLNEDKTYRIENRIIKLMENSFSEMNLFEIPGFEKVAKIIQTNSTLKPFVIDRLNISNNINKYSPMGISVFANAIDTMKSCDLIFDSLSNEFVIGKKRIMVTEEAIQLTDGEKTFDERDVVFYVLPQKAGEDKKFIKEIDMTLRTEEHSKALQDSLNIFTSQCGLGENYYRFDGGSLSTATQVLSEQNTLFKTLKKHEIILDGVLIDLIRLVISLGKNTMGLPLDEETEINIRFDDSIIEDTESQKQSDLRLVNADIFSRVEYRMKWLGETEEEAVLAIRRIDSGYADAYTEEDVPESGPVQIPVPNNGITQR